MPALNLLDQINTGCRWGFQDLLVSGNLAYCLTRNEVLTVVDLSGPSDLRLLAEFELPIPFSARSLSINQDFLYISTLMAGILVLDVSDPANPFTVGYIESPEAAWSVVAYRGHVFAGLEDETIQISPAQCPNTMTSTEPVLFATTEQDGVRLSWEDRSFQLEFQLLGNGPISSWPVSFQEPRPGRFSAFDRPPDLDEGAMIRYELLGRQPGEPWEVVSWREISSSFSHQTGIQTIRPNPANPGTEIAFSLACPDHVKLSVFDLRGRLQIKLIDDWLGAGVKTISWDGCDRSGEPVASGSYLLRLETSQQIDRAKVMIIR